MALIDFESKINTITPIHIACLNLKVRIINVGAQKIDCLIMKIYKMVIVKFLVYNKLDKIQFFKKTFLLVNTSMKVVLIIFFLSFNNADIEFTKQKKLT